MNINFKSTTLKILFFIGLVLAFMSMFTDWYYYKAQDSNGIIAEWILNTFTGWRTTFIPGIASNEYLKPNDFMEISIMSILLVGLIIICGYGTLIKDIEITNSIDKSKPYIYLNVFLIMIIGYYIVIIPCAFLFTHTLYFPFMVSKDLNTGIIHSYSIGPAYLMQLASFIMIFPHILLSVFILNRFRTETTNPESQIKKKLEESREEIAIDKFIAELTAKASEKKNYEAKIVYKQFQKQRRRKMHE